MSVTTITNLTRESRFFCINGALVPGVQSIRTDFGANSEVLKYLGNQADLYIPKGQSIGVSTVSTLVVSADNWISLTGNSSFNGLILKSKTSLEDNFILENSYLTNYIFKASLGQNPSIDTTITSFGTVGTILPAEASPSILADLATLASVDPYPVLSNFSLGAIDTNIDIFDTNALTNCEIQINTPRLPIYTIGNREPKQVFQQFPIEIALTLQFELNDYDFGKSNDFPKNNHSKDIQITLKNNENQIINTYSFNGMIFDKQNSDFSAESPFNVSLQYKKSIF